MRLPPLIVTAHLDDASFAPLERLRQRHFPPELNKIPAHISLFHHLPGDERFSIIGTVAALCRDGAPILLEPTNVLFLGRGVALAYRSAELDRLHGRLARAWRPWLTAQDRQPFKAHVTIQNKVAPAEARALFEALQLDSAPPCRVDGVTIWRYLGGPWDRVETCLFGP